MKKTIVTVFVFAFLLGVMGTVAQGKKENKFDKPGQAKNVEVFKKKALSESERKSLNEVEKGLKGKPSKPSPVNPSVGGVTGVLGNSLPEGGKRYAIVIGIANYAGIENDLCVDELKTGLNNSGTLCKDDDASNMEAVLTGNFENGETYYNYGYAPENIFRFSDSEATFNNIKAKIDYLVGTETTPGILTEKDELIFFFSGHGSAGEFLEGDDGESLDEAIFVYDQDYDEADFLADPASYVSGNSCFIWDDQLRAWFANSPTSRILFVFDTCRAGGMNDLQSDGRVLAMSSAENQSSYTYYLGGENGQESEGLFAHYFVKRGMRDMWGDGSNPLNKRSTNPPKYDGEVAAEEAFNSAYSYVKTLQIPVLNDKFYNDLLLGH